MMLAALLIAAATVQGTVVPEPAAVRCNFTVALCRDTLPDSPWDDPLCSEREQNDALLEKDDREALRTRYLATTSIPERIRLAGALLRRVPGDDAMWEELAGYAELAVRHPAIHGEPPPAFVAWREQHAVPWTAWRTIQIALLVASEDPRSRPMLLQALDTGGPDLVYVAILGLATQQDATALPAIARALQRMPDRGVFARALEPFHLPAARALAAKHAEP